MSDLTSASWRQLLHAAEAEYQQQQPQPCHQPQQQEAERAISTSATTIGVAPHPHLPHQPLPLLDPIPPPPPPPLPCRWAFAADTTGLTAAPTLRLHLPAKPDHQQLAELCCLPETSIALLDNFVAALALPTAVFAEPKLLAQLAGDLTVEVRRQWVCEGRDPELNLDGRLRESWRFAAKTEAMALGDYLAYQRNFKAKRSRLEAASTPPASSLPAPGLLSSPSSSPSSSSSSPASAASSPSSSPATAVFKSVLFATNVDLLEPRFAPYLQPIYDALPPFLRWTGPDTLLGHLGFPIPGMSAVQMYIKVPGCRTPGHQENNCMASVNINLGPGACVWYAVDGKYKAAMDRLCLAKARCVAEKGSWWPAVRDLLAAGIPVMRFVQESGALVMVGPGCIHWVQALGKCTCISWNIGLLRPHQWMQAWASYRHNLQIGHLSLVPMQRLTLTLCAGWRHVPLALRWLVFDTLQHILYSQRREWEVVMEWNDCRLEKHVLRPGDPSFYCDSCEQEIVNFFFKKPPSTAEAAGLAAAAGPPAAVLCVACRNAEREQCRRTLPYLPDWLKHVFFCYTLEELRLILAETVPALSGAGIEVVGSLH